MQQKNTNKITIALLENESAERQQRIEHLLNYGIQTNAVVSAEHLYKMLLTEKVNAFVIDLDGSPAERLDIVAYLTSIYKSPIICLRPKETTDLEISALQTGADRCFEKPIAAEILATNIKIAIKRSAASIDVSTQDDGSGLWQVDTQRWTLISPSAMTLKLTEREFLFVKALFASKGNTLSKQYLWENVFKISVNDKTQRMDMMISRLRKKAKSVFNEELPIRTAYLSGYAFTSPCKLI